MEFEKFLEQLDALEIDLTGHYTAIKFFGFFHTEIAGSRCFSTGDLNGYYEKADLILPSNISKYLADMRDVKQEIKPSDGGYRLVRHVRNEVKIILEGTPARREVSEKLTSLPAKLKTASEKEFLEEAINCFSIRANRATIIMVWNLCIEHMYEYILQNKLTEFNTALSRQQGVRVPAVTSKDDFHDIRDVRFIEICRSVDIISNDVRKILDTKLGTRNSCAHPSDIQVRESKVVDFIEDLVENVILKYEV